MMIPKYARKNFEPNPNDDKKTALLKKYYLEKDRISQLIENQTIIEELEQRIAMEELLKS